MKDRINKNKGIRPIIRTVIFILLVACLLFYLNQVFDLKDNKNSEQVFNAFYSEEKDSLDGIYLGSSAVYRFFIPTRAYEKEGMCIFSLTTSAQPIVLNKYLIEEALKTQSKSKIIIIEIRNMVKEAGFQEADIRRATDTMKFSKTRTAAIEASLKYYKSLGVEMDMEESHYLYPFLKYHNRWQSDIELEDLKGTDINTKYKGYINTGSIFSGIDQSAPEEITYSEKVPKEQMDAFKDLVQYCKTLDQDVLFVSSPFKTSDQRYAKLNTVCDYIEDQGFTVLNFNRGPLRYELNLDYSADFFQFNHTNIYGARKYTDYLTNYIAENYDLPDHRGDPKYESWDKAAADLEKDLKVIKKQQEKEQ